MNYSPRPLRILWTLPYLPWPTSNGGRTREYALLRQLAKRGHRITLLCLAKDKPTRECVSHLSEFLEKFIVVPRRSRTHPMTLLSALFSLNRPAVATVNGCNQAYSRVLDKLLQQDFDLLQAEHSYAFEPLRQVLRSARGTKACRQTDEGSVDTGSRGVPVLRELLGRYNLPVILTEHNVESEIIRQQYMRFPRALRVLSRFDEMRARIWERSVLQSVSCVVAVTGEDQAKFQAMGIQATSVVPNCIDTSAFRHVAPNTSARNVLFVGNYEYAPNIEAVKRLCDAIMPMVWRSYPDATLSICGYKTPREWSRRWTDKRIVFTGYVSQLADVHATATVFVAPIESGGGSKLKVLEAMASSLPIVATSEGMSGLDVRPGIHFLAGETDGEISRSIGIAFADPKKACSLGTMAREYVVRQHDWTVAADMLERIYMEHTRWSTPD